jgi:hypothetical protein
MIKIYGHRIEHQPKNKILFETMINLKKATKKKSCNLFSNQSIIKG